MGAAEKEVSIQVSSIPSRNKFFRDPYSLFPLPIQIAPEVQLSPFNIYENLGGRFCNVDFERGERFLDNLRNPDPKKLPAEKLRKNYGNLILHMAENAGLHPPDEEVVGLFNYFRNFTIPLEGKALNPQTTTEADGLPDQQLLRECYLLVGDLESCLTIPFYDPKKKE